MLHFSRAMNISASRQVYDVIDIVSFTSRRAAHTLHDDLTVNTRGREEEKKAAILISRRAPAATSA